MAKDIAQATNNKGVAGWSLKTDDNATVDPTINWQEGQAPSTVNNSARAMMTRIREEHDLIFNTLENSWGSKFLYVEISSYTLEKNHIGIYTLNMVLSKKLTDEQYADFQKGKLLLAVNWGNGIAIENDSLYKSLTTLDVITLSLSIPTASTTHRRDPYINLSFFGSRYDTNRITLHELSYIVNNIVEYVADPSNTMRTVRSIPMHRSYIASKMFTVKDDINNEVTVKLSWYYISPCEIVLIVEPSGPCASSGEHKGYRYFSCDLGLSWNFIVSLDSTTPIGVLTAFESDVNHLPQFGVSSFSAGGGSGIFLGLPDDWDGIRYRFHAKLTTDDHFKLYPINVNPEPNRTYPIIA